MSIENLFPNLASTGYRETSPDDPCYNCIAWAAGEDHIWWEPSEDGYWPENVPMEYTLEALIQAFETRGYIRCDDGSLEEGIEKIALYGDDSGYAHAARQLSDSKWTSKIGQDIDIEHESLTGLEGASYGSVLAFVKRAKEP